MINEMTYSSRTITSQNVNNAWWKTSLLTFNNKLYLICSLLKKSYLNLTSTMSLATCNAERGVCSATFMTTQQPAAKAGPNFQALNVRILCDNI